MRPRASLDLEEDAHLLRVGVRGELRGDGGAIEAVIFQDSLDARDGLLHPLIGEQFAQAQLAGIHQLVLGRTVPGSARQAHRADELVLPGDEYQRKLVLRRGLDRYLDILEAPGGIQRMDAAAQLALVEGLAGFLRDQRQQPVRVHDRGHTAKLNVVHRPAGEGVQRSKVR